MLFAAKIVAGETAHIQTVIPGTLLLTNITLEEDSTAASLYLQASQENVLIVALASPSLTAYHTELRLNLSEKGKQVLNAKNGSIYVVGHFTPSDPTKQISSIDEALTIKRGDSAKQAVKATPSTQTSTSQHGKKEVKQKHKSDEEDEPRKRSIRVKNTQPAKPLLKQKKEAKASSKTKGNSLLEMMYNMNDDDDDDESDYSQESQQQSDSSSSSSDEEDSDETPKRSTSKRTAKQQKIQRKEEEHHRQEKIWDEAIDTIDGNKDEDHHYITEITNTQAHACKEQKASQQSNVVQDLPISNYTKPVQAEIKSSLQRISKLAMLKIMHELPLPPTQSSSRNSSTDDKAYEQGWLAKYRNAADLFQKQISSLIHQSQISRSKQEKQLLLQSQKLREQITALREASKEASAKIQAIKKKEAEERRRPKAEGREDERSFSYRIPTVIPEFALRK